jgi:hypothetical protein
VLLSQALLDRSLPRRQIGIQRIDLSQRVALGVDVGIEPGGHFLKCRDHLLPLALFWCQLQDTPGRQLGFEPCQAIAIGLRLPLAALFFHPLSGLGLCRRARNLLLPDLLSALFGFALAPFMLAGGRSALLAFSNASVELLPVKEAQQPIKLVFRCGTVNRGYSATLPLYSQVSTSRSSVDELDHVQNRARRRLHLPRTRPATAMI